MQYLHVHVLNAVVVYDVFKKTVGVELIEIEHMSKIVSKEIAEIAILTDGFFMFIRCASVRLYDMQ